MRPLIGITTNCVVNSDQNGGEYKCFRLAEQYARAIIDAGGIPVLLPTIKEYSDDLETLLDRVDGLLLSGGNGMAGVHFKRDSDRPPTLRETDPDRYDAEFRLVVEACRRRIPMMGICRGHQMIVEAFGGKVALPDVDSWKKGILHLQQSDHSEPTHSIGIAAGSLMAEALGERQKVNSFHRQVATLIPEGLQAVAWSQDGLIEAVESEDPFALGCQFHPEWLYNDNGEFLELFRVMIRRACNRATHRL